MVVASNNKGKIEEIKAILDVDVYSLKDKGINIDVEENGSTFKDNATIKAKAIYDICHEEVIADDSGLCIDCLDGFPGVLTNRFLGKDATNDEKNDYLLNEVNKHDNRSCKFICAITYYNGKDLIEIEQALNGRISLSKRGSNGFGFDEIFELDNGKTLAELEDFEKNEISARYLALVELKKKLKG